ncbi:MAG: HAMP domain-containing histidine kinase [Verrucomicrobia bacterium]|nr:HAMP domain-containing histidine kinase [Leptolyngbya sp. ES-bin-22]
MNWTDLVWLGLGLVLGLSWRSRSPRSRSAEAESPLNHWEQDSPSWEPLQLESLQLAYQLAMAMSQFKGGFLARTSHELRSPLNGLIGMQQLILQDLCDSPEEEREFIEQANQSALKMIKVLDNVLDVARLEHGTIKMELQPLQLAALLQAVYDLTYLQAADRNLKLHLILPEPDLYVLADPRRLRQVLLHLVDTLMVQMTEGRIQVSVQAATGYARIWIDSDRAIDLSEPIDLLHLPSEPTAAIPSPGLNLLTLQILVSLMQGTLTLLTPAAETAADEADNLQARVQCSIPLVVPE